MNRRLIFALLAPAQEGGHTQVILGVGRRLSGHLIYRLLIGLLVRRLLALLLASIRIAGVVGLLRRVGSGLRAGPVRRGSRRHRPRAAGEVGAVAFIVAWTGWVRFSVPVFLF